MIAVNGVLLMAIALWVGALVLAANLESLVLFRPRFGPHRHMALVREMKGNGAADLAAFMVGRGWTAKETDAGLLALHSGMVSGLPPWTLVRARLQPDDSWLVEVGIWKSILWVHVCATILGVLIPTTMRFIGTATGATSSLWILPTIHGAIVWWALRAVAKDAESLRSFLQSST